MYLIKLKQLLEKYDLQKGLKRKLFGDPLAIKALRELINERETQTHDLDITFKEYQDFVHKKNYSIDFYDAYFLSNSAGSNIFKEWRETEEIFKIQPLKESELNLSFDFLKINPLSLEELEPRYNTIDLSSQENLPPFSIDPLSLERLNQQYNTINLSSQENLHPYNFLGHHFYGLFPKENSFFYQKENKFYNFTGKEKEEPIVTEEQKKRFRDTASVRKVARMLSQLFRDEKSSENRLPLEILIHIASKAHSGSLDEAESKKMAENYFGKPS